MSTLSARAPRTTEPARRRPAGLSPRWGRRARLLAALMPLLCSACVPIEPEPPLNAKGDPIELPGPADRWLEVVQSTPAPGTVALRPSFAFTFNDYLDEESFKSYNFATVSSGGIRTNGRAFYRMSDKTVVWRPNSNLVAGLVYRIELKASLKSATGAPFLKSDTTSRVFIPAADAPPDDSPERTRALPDTTWPEVETIFEAACASCHSDPDWQLNTLSHDALIGASSTQTDLYLVRPGNPAGSYLMRKVLWDYPDLAFTPQPPPWSDSAQELDREDLLKIEGWIAGGARR